jgi:hypothetical protein
MTDENKLGDAPITDEFITKMNKMAEFLDNVFNGENLEERSTGFILMIFPFGETQGNESRCNYISNAKREDVVNLLRAQLDRFESQQATKN